jgi:RNA polymerase sigma-70 factor (ECF subfamily)
MTISFRKRAPSILTLVEDTAAAPESLAPAPEVLAPVETFESFYLREFPRILVLARALAGATFAEDMAQETMMAAFRRWPQISQMKSPAGYVRGICVNKAASLTHRVIAERRALQRYASHARLEPLSPDDEQFWAAVRSLPRRQAQCAALYYALDLSVEEVATALDCAQGTVKAHLFRARAALGRALTDTQETS